MHHPSGTLTGTLTGYLAPADFEADLAHEIGLDPAARVLAQHGRLFLVERSAGAVAHAMAWAQNTWADVQSLPITSIGDGARQLRGIQRNWALWPIAHHRRAALIEESLPPLKPRPLVFGQALPTAPLGGWTLAEPGLILAAARTASAVPHGEMTFVEDREAPPSRAYLKMWEALTLAGVRPGPGDTCLDLGASPGGWTWVAASLCATVDSVDKADLDPRIAAMAGVRVRRESAFAIEPAKSEPVDWLFCDVICYPDRLLKLIERWLAAGKARRVIATLKFQGATDFDTITRFKAIPNSRLVHLHHNKHELTWMRL